MSDALTPLLVAIRDLVTQLPPSTVDGIARQLETAGASINARNLTAIGVTPAAKRALERVGLALVGTGQFESRSLALALRAASGIAADLARRQTIEIAWTGPASESVPVRRVDQAMYELIEGAGEHVLLVTYAAYRAERVIAALKVALGRGVSIDLVVELAETSGGRLAFDSVQGLREHLPGARILWWPRAKRPLAETGGVGSMHAKCLVVDREVALVSSANLTDYALERNMELGLIVRDGDLPQRLARHFEQLAVRGELRPVAEANGG